MSGRDVRSLARAFVEAHDAHASAVRGRIAEIAEVVRAGLGSWMTQGLCVQFAADEPGDGARRQLPTSQSMESARRDLLGAVARAVTSASPLDEDVEVARAFADLEAAEEALCRSSWVIGDADGEARAAAVSAAYFDAWRRFRAVVQTKAAAWPA